MTTFKKLSLDDQIKVLKRVKNYPTLRENLELLEKVDPIVNKKKDGRIVFRGNNKELFTNPLPYLT